jgi:hypothetical protein
MYKLLLEIEVLEVDVGGGGGVHRFNRDQFVSG